MTIQIHTNNKEQISNRTYFTFEGSIETKRVAVMIVSGASNYVNVRVKNASHKVWRGNGRDFQNIDAAIEHYNDPKIIELIKTAKSFNK